MTTDDDIKRHDVEIRGLRTDIQLFREHTDMKFDGIMATLKEHSESIARIDERTSMTNKIAITMIVAIMVQFLATVALYRKWI